MLYSDNIITKSRVRYKSPQEIGLPNFPSTSPQKDKTYTPLIVVAPQRVICSLGFAAENYDSLRSYFKSAGCGHIIVSIQIIAYGIGK